MDLIYKYRVENRYQCKSVIEGKGTMHKMVKHLPLEFKEYVMEKYERGDLKSCRLISSDYIFELREVNSS